MALLGLPIAALALLALSALGRRNVRHAWIGCVCLSLGGVVLAATLQHIPSETSDAAVATGASLGLCLGTAIMLYGPRAMGRAGAFAFATLVAGLGWIPGYFLGCGVVEWLPV